MTGRIVTVSKDEFAYEADGRRLSIWVEHGTALIVHGTPGRWDDGAEATADDLRAAQAALQTEAQRRGWRLDTVTDFVRDAQVRRFAAGVEALAPGRVRDRATGAELELTDRHTVRYRLGPRTAEARADRDTRAMSVTLRDTVRWDDGQPLSAAERATAADAVARAGAWWGWWSGGNDEGHAP